MKARKDKHNFHVSPIKGWQYTGDVNIEYGGVFFKTSDLLELEQCLESGSDNFPLIGCLSVSEIDMWDKVYVLDFCPVFINTERLHTALALCKENGSIPSAFEIAYSIQSYYGQETSYQEIVRIGKSTENARLYPKPDTILAHNAILANYVRNKLKGA